MYLGTDAAPPAPVTIGFKRGSPSGFGGTMAYHDWHRISIVNNVYRGSQNPGFFHWHDIGPAANEAELIKVSGNVISTYRFGVWLQAETERGVGLPSTSVWNHIDISSNTFNLFSNSLDQRGIYIEGINYSLTNLLIQGNDINCALNSASDMGRPVEIDMGLGPDTGTGIAEVKNISIQENKFEGSSKNMAGDIASVLLNSPYAKLSEIVYSGNTFRGQIAFHIQSGTCSEGFENITYSNNSSQGKHAFLMTVSLGTDIMNMYNFVVSGNNHEYFDDSGTQLANEYFPFGITVFDGVPETNLYNAVITGNTVEYRTPDPLVPLGGVGLRGLHDITNINVSNNVVHQPTAPAVFLSYTGIGKSVSVCENNTRNAQIFDSGSGGFYRSTTAAIHIEYGDWIAGAVTLPRGITNSSITVNDNHLNTIISTGSTKGAAIVIEGHPDIPADNEFIGIANLSVCGNSAVNVIGEQGYYFDFPLVKYVLKSIKIDNNLLGTGLPSNLSTPQGFNTPKSGIIFQGPSATPLTTDEILAVKVEDISLCGNQLIHRPSASTHHGIRVGFDADIFDEKPFEIKNVSVNNNEINSLCAGGGSVGLGFYPSCSATNISVSYNKILAESLADGDFPRNGLLFTHYVQQCKVELFQNVAASDGNSFNITTGGLRDEVAVAGLQPRGGLSSDFLIYSPLSSDPLNPATAFLNNIFAMKWQSINIDGNTINCDSIFPTGGANSQYPRPVQGYGDLAFNTVNGIGTLVGGRKFTTMTVWGLSISNNVLRGNNTSDESEQHCGFLIHTMPVYGQWGAGDPDPTPVTSNARCRLVCQGWIVQSNSSSGYAVKDGVSQIYGYDQYHLALLSTNTVLDEQGLCTNNVAYGHDGSYVLPYGNISTFWIEIGPAADLVNKIYENATVVR